MELDEQVCLLRLLGCRLPSFVRVAPKSAADFAFLLHGLHYLKDDDVMAIILPHGVLFRSGAEERIRRKLLDDGHIDTVIGLPANLFYSTGTRSGTRRRSNLQSPAWRYGERRYEQED